ncbi:hypothetical protein [Phaeodactylibacter sp.]|uniref:hypothetical protein n=1 Tax=Phaeodactylibacter sp. TaxID=1940289 RepID=UPI0025D21780|nr:hypothetical protein [Phaeodactylibacter sp.]MCI4651686.1 hypothetical protein [Phaeodactylibacter sp.]MCI5092005.1 hypothetical protein [Phaeodactylibacter sp.]
MNDLSLIGLVFKATDFSKKPKSISKVFEFLPFSPTDFWDKGIEGSFANSQLKSRPGNSSWVYREVFSYGINLLIEDKLERFLLKFHTSKRDLLSVKHEEMEYDLEVHYSHEDVHNGLIFNRAVMTLIMELEMDLGIYPISKNVLQEQLNSDDR